jgi:hypothetical protein
VTDRDRLQPDEPVLVTGGNHLHRVGYVISVQGVDSVYVQPTAFDGTQRHDLGASPRSEREPNVVRLRDMPSGRLAGCVVLEQAGGDDIRAAQLIAPVEEERWDAWVGCFRDGVVAPGVKMTIDLRDCETPAAIADAIESQRRATRGSSTRISRCR